MEGDDGEHVDEEDDDAADGDGPGQVPHRVLHLLNDEVEVVPAGVGEEAGVEGEGDDGGVLGEEGDQGDGRAHRLAALPGEVLGPPVSQLDEPGGGVGGKEVLPGDADEDEGDHLGVGEVVLDLKEIRPSGKAGRASLELASQSTTSRVVQTQRAALTL